MIDKIPLAINIYTFLDHEILIFIGIIVQFLSLFFKVNLLNWKDDLINIVTFCALHCFISCCIFVLIPWLNNSNILEAKQQLVFVSLFTVLAFLKILNTIPLEFTLFRKKAEEKKVFIDFYEYYKGLRQSILAQIESNTPYDEMRIKWIKEKLPRQAKKKSTDISRFS